MDDSNRVVVNNTLRTGREWIEGLNSHPYKNEYDKIIFSGGEPSLHPDFFEIVAKVKGFKSKIVVTNLSFDVNRMIDACRAAGSRVIIQPSFHFEHASFEVFVEKMRKLKSNNMLSHFIPASVVGLPDRTEPEDFKKRFKQEGFDISVYKFEGYYNGKFNYADINGFGSLGIYRRVSCSSSSHFACPNGDIVVCPNDTYAKEAKTYGNICDKIYENIKLSRICDHYGSCHISSASWVKIKSLENGKTIWRGKNFIEKSPLNLFRIWCERNNYKWLSKVKYLYNNFFVKFTHFSFADLKSKNIKNSNKILVFELWGIGDVVLSTGLLQVLRKAFLNSEITLLAKEHAKSILFTNGSVDKFIVYDFPWTKFKRKYHLWRWDWLGLIRLVKRLRAEKFDLILDARGDIRNNFLSFLIGAKRRIGYDWTGGGYFLTDIVKCKQKNLHRVDAWANLIKHLGLKDINVNPVIMISEEEKRWVDEFFQSEEIDKEKLIIGIHPGARIKTRRWPLDRFGKVADYVIDTYKAKVIVFIDPEGTGDDISIKGKYMSMKLSLRQLIAVLPKLGLFICNDGGPMHLAAAAGVPIVSIFGPTEPKWFGPYGQKDAVVIKKNFSCRPCFDRCSLRKPACLESIDFEQVNQRIAAKLKRVN